MRALILTLVLTAAAAAPAPAAGPDPAAGRAAFERHCAACHGRAAQGDGPMAEILTMPVPDLTRLAVRAGGAFPMLRVVRVIDGRDARAGHGGPMPVFGALFDGPGGALDAEGGDPLLTNGRILSIADYLESLQVAP